MFDTYPADPASGITVSGETANVITGSDLVTLSLLGIRVTGYEALIITQYRAQEIGNLLGSIPAHASIDDETSAALLARTGPAWTLWELLYQIKDRTKNIRFGAVSAATPDHRRSSRPPDNRIGRHHRAPPRQKSWSRRPNHHAQLVGPSPRTRSYVHDRIRPCFSSHSPVLRVAGRGQA